MLTTMANIKDTNPFDDNRIPKVFDICLSELLRSDIKLQSVKSNTNIDSGIHVIH
jgi:hypothetical protein